MYISWDHIVHLQSFWSFIHTCLFLEWSKVAKEVICLPHEQEIHFWKKWRSKITHASQVSKALDNDYGVKFKCFYFQKFYCYVYFLWICLECAATCFQVKIFSCSWSENYWISNSQLQVYFPFKGLRVFKNSTEKEKYNMPNVTLWVLNLC